MNTIDVTVVRVYILDASGLLKKIEHYLKDTVKIRGMSVFRAIGGFGSTGEHTASLMDLSLNLPLVIEFFDRKEKIDAALNYLSTLVRPEHLLFWEAKANDE